MTTYRLMPASASRIFLAGATTWIALGFAGTAMPVQAQQGAAPATIVQVAKLTLEQESALRNEATASMNSTLQTTSAATKPSDSDRSAGKLSVSAPALLSDKERCGQLPSVGSVSPFPISLRLGAMLSPSTKFDGGIDVTLPGVHLAPNLSTRIDADVILSANFGGISTLIPITVDQIFSQGLVAGSKFYIGAGIGPYIGDTTRLGGKVFVGAGISSRLTGEVSMHFPGFGDPLFTAQVRVGL